MAQSTVKRVRLNATEWTWRICRQDGELVGFYASKALAEKALAAAWYLR